VHENPFIHIDYLKAAVKKVLIQGVKKKTTRN